MKSAAGSETRRQRSAASRAGEPSCQPLNQDTEASEPANTPGQEGQRSPDPVTRISSAPPTIPKTPGTPDPPTGRPRRPVGENGYMEPGDGRQSENREKHEEGRQEAFSGVRAAFYARPVFHLGRPLATPRSIASCSTRPRSWRGLNPETRLSGLACREAIPIPAKGITSSMWWREHRSDRLRRDAPCLPPSLRPSAPKFAHDRGPGNVGGLVGNGPRRIFSAGAPQNAVCRFHAPGEGGEKPPGQGDTT